MRIDRHTEEFIKAVAAQTVAEVSMRASMQLGTKICDAVFHIRCGEKENDRRMGTGFKMTYRNMTGGDNGLLFTAAHIVEDLFPKGLDRLEIRTSQGWQKWEDAELVGINEADDIAVVKWTQPQTGIRPQWIELRCGAGVVQRVESAIGGEVLVAGYPMGMGGGRRRKDGWPRAVVHKGNLSGGFPEEEPRAAMSDGSLTRGFSGGPVVATEASGAFNAGTAVIGIVREHTPSMGEDRQNHQGMFLAAATECIRDCEWLPGAQDWMKML